MSRLTPPKENEYANQHLEKHRDYTENDEGRAFLLDYKRSNILFQFHPSNKEKSVSIVSMKGSCDFTTVDPFINKIIALLPKKIKSKKEIKTKLTTLVNYYDQGMLHDFIANNLGTYQVSNENFFFMALLFEKKFLFCFDENGNFTFRLSSKIGFKTPYYPQKSDREIWGWESVDGEGLEIKSAGSFIFDMDIIFKPDGNGFSLKEKYIKASNSVLEEFARTEVDASTLNNFENISLFFKRESEAENATQAILNTLPIEHHDQQSPLEFGVKHKLIIITLVSLIAAGITILTFSFLPATVLVATATIIGFSMLHSVPQILILSTCTAIIAATLTTMSVNIKKHWKTMLYMTVGILISTAITAACVFTLGGGIAAVGTILGLATLTTATKGITVFGGVSAIGGILGFSTSLLFNPRKKTAKPFEIEKTIDNRTSLKETLKKKWFSRGSWGLFSLCKPALSSRKVHKPDVATP